MNTFKILFITHRFYPDVGGTEANAEFLAESFLRYGAQVHVMTWTKSLGEKVFPFDIVRHPTIEVIIKEHSWADVVFENSPTLKLSWPNIIFKKPLVVSLNTWLDDDTGKLSWQSKLKLKWLARAKYVIAVSEAVRRRSWNSAIVIENAFNDQLFTKYKPFNERRIDFVFLGRLVSDKGVDLAIQALARLNKDCQNKMEAPLLLTVVGNGVDAEYLQTQAKELGVNDYVNFKGSLTGQTLVKCLNEHKFILVPSVWDEPFGIVVLEGMACGCIPIVSNGGGLPDAVGDAGLVFKKRSVDDLVYALQKILGDLELQDCLQKKAIGHLNAHSPDIIAKQYFTLIQASL